MKTPVKSLLLSALLSIAAIASIAYFSCNRDLCKTISCAHGGICNGGLCTCVAGYEGVNCATVSRNKFIGTWNVFEKGSYTDAAQYVVTIDSGNIITQVIIRNFNNRFTLPVIADVATGTLTIESQDLQKKRVFGTGVITPNATYAQDDYMVVQYEVVDSLTGNADDYGFDPIFDGSNSSQWNKN